MERYDCFFTELFLALGFALRFVLGAAAGFAGTFDDAAFADVFAGAFMGALTGAGAGAFLLAAAFAALAASAIGATLPLGLVAAASTVTALGVASVVFPLPAFPLAAVPLAAPLPFFRPHLPKVRSGAAASRVWHSSNVRLFGSLSLGILALRHLSVLYGP